MVGNPRWISLLAGLLSIVVVVAACSSGSETDTHDHAHLGEEFELRVNESREIEANPSTGPLTLTFDGVTRDSRCPRDVTCVRAGEAFVHLIARFETGQPTELTLEVPPDGKASARFDVYDINASALEPHPESTRQISPGEYAVTLTVFGRL